MKGAELYDRLQGILGSGYAYVLHGTHHQTEILEPRQATLDNAERPSLSECGIYGSFQIEIAIFYALIREDKNNWGWSIHPRDSTITLIAPRQFKGSPGYLYVLPREPFIKSICGGFCLIAYEPIKPLEVLEVHPEVLEYIQLERGVRVETC